MRSNLNVPEKMRSFRSQNDVERKRARVRLIDIFFPEYPNAKAEANALAILKSDREREPWALETPLKRHASIGT